MTARKVLLAVGGIAVLTAAAATGVVALAARPKPAEVQPPEIGGQKAPSAVREIDFDKRYDAHCVLIGTEETVFTGCKVVGFTGRNTPGGDGSGGSGFSSGSRDYQHFDRWLVLELSDGRLAYIPPGSLKYLETARAP